MLFIMNATLEWRTVEKFPEYVVSEYGDIIRVIPDKMGRLSGICLKLIMTRKGYLQVGLTHNGIYKTCRVHRLVSIAFNGPPPSPLHGAAHFDGNKTNNHRSNLRWATSKENHQDRVRHGTDFKGTRNPLVKLTEDQVNAIRLEVASESCRRQDEIANDYGVYRTTISKIKNGRRWASTVEQNESQLSASI